MEIIIASNNQGKIAEFKEILTPLGYTVKSLKDKNINIEIEETGKTFEENALIKAKTIYNLTKTSVIADDSGLEVECLNNEPGVYSARYKGLTSEQERRTAILEQLKNKENRKAKFNCCICYINNEGQEKIVTGVLEGTISYEEKGHEGFGYDSIFIPKGYNKTTAQLGEKIKNEISHRAIAIKELLKILK